MVVPEALAVQGEVEVTAAGARRLRNGHLWVYAADVRAAGSELGTIVLVKDAKRNPLGYALHSPRSQIRIRMLTRDDHPPTQDLIRERIRTAIQRRRERLKPESACRLVYGEADLLPSIIVDRYGDHLVLQTLSAGADALKQTLVEILVDLLHPAGILERNDVKTRHLEGLDEIRGVLAGSVPEQVQVNESGVRFWIDLHHGQKTGFYLDQSDNRVAARGYACGRGLDCFTNSGAFALHFATRCHSVLAVDASAEALRQARRNAELNGAGNVEFQEGNVFDALRDRERAGERFDIICLDPPAFAKNRKALPAARGGYKEINLRAMKLLEPQGILVTSSCSYQLSEEDFIDLLRQAAADARRPMQMVERRAQSTDHPVLLGMPEMHYLKCCILRAV